ncbi:MAG: zinc ribbon domain-containing protein [Clostridia bacterium]|nr:zinc ribbon domain-containing protein [Clostridia bacterium]
MTFDKLFETIKEHAQNAGVFAARTASKAGKKAEKMYHTSKHQIAIFDLKNDITTLYKEIGELIYATHKNGDETAEDIEAKLAIIDEKMARIEELKDIIDEIKDAKTCDSCGTKNEKSSEYCKKCGKKI